MQMGWCLQVGREMEGAGACCCQMLLLLLRAAGMVCRYEVRKKKKVAACIDEIAEMVVDKFTDKLGANKQAWRVQVCGQGAGGVAGGRHLQQQQLYILVSRHACAGQQQRGASCTIGTHAARCPSHLGRWET